jgi:radical SAM protein with 4Fe4S-binding SPASM domain
MVQAGEKTTSSDMLSHDHQKVLGLRHDNRGEWKLKHDVNRVVLYKYNNEVAEATNASLIHPAEAIVLALFDGKKTVADVEATVAGLFSVSIDTACPIVGAILQRHSEALTDGFQADAPTYDPSTFVIPADQVNMDTSRFFRPLSLLFRVSDDCMRSCVYCSSPKPATKLKLLSLDRYNELADECLQMQISAILIGGGDPFMRSDIVELIKIWTSRGIHPFITTKSFVSDLLAQRLADAGLRRMQVSFDSPVEKTADFMTGSRGFFKQAVVSIRNLLSNGIGVRINCIVTSHNVEQMPDLVRLLGDLGVYSLTLSPVGRSMHISDFDSLFFDESEYKWFEKCRDVSRQYPGMRIKADRVEDPGALSVEERNVRYPSRSLCTAGRWGLVIMSDGKVVTCDEVPAIEPFVVGDVSYESVAEVWSSPKIRYLQKPPRNQFLGTACFDCPDFDECHTGKGRCFRDAMKVYGSFYAPTPACPRAPRGLRLY